MFLSLFLIIFIGIIGGYLFEKIKLPKLIFYLILGILLGPSVFNLIDNDLLNISGILRNIALVIILTRSGLSLDIKTLKSIGRPAVLMCFIPAIFEILGILLIAPIILKISYLEALLLGSVLAAVSPAVIVPRMIKLKDSKYNKYNLAELVLAGSSVDDIFVIVLFYSFKSMIQINKFEIMNIINIPISIILGIILGIIIGYFISIMFKKINLNIIYKSLILLSISFMLIYLENVLKPYIAISSLISIIVLSIILKKFNNTDSIQIQNTYNSLWSFFEIILFTLIGAITLVDYAFSKEGLIILGIILIALIFRSIGVFICLIKTKYNNKMKLFIILSYLPKATVQASIGGIALSEGMACGNYILTAAVIAILFTAPIGAILMDNLYKKLLK